MHSQRSRLGTHRSVIKRQFAVYPLVDSNARHNRHPLEPNATARYQTHPSSENLHYVVMTKLKLV